jgi:hypothetical protein
LGETIADASALFFPPIQPAATETPATGGMVILADSSRGADLLDTTEAIRPIVESCAHRDTQTPLMIGVVGPRGAGKSFALDRLAAGVESLGAAAARTANGPFLRRIVTARIDAAAIAGDPAGAIAGGVFAALARARPDGDYAALADEAAHAGADPHLAASKAMERHDESRRRLEAERQARDDVEARRALLVENVLFETAGSRIDAYARGNRSRIEAKLRRLDLAGADSIASFKHLVREVAEAGWGALIWVPLGAIWAYRSQRRLLMATLIFLALAFGAAELRTPRTLDGLRNLGPPFPPAADWLAAQSGPVGDVVVALAALGALALTVNLWRAISFMILLLRGARLLNHDVRERRRDLDAASARLNRRVMALTAETDTAARHAEASERRAHARGEAGAARAPTPPFVDPALAGPSAARAFLHSVGALIAAQPADDPFAHAAAGQASRAVLGPQAPAPPTPPLPAVPAPDRLLLLVDNLDALTPAQGLNLIEALHFLLGESFIAVVACDPAPLGAAAGGSDRLRARLEKLFQLTFDVGPPGATDSERLMARLVGGAPQRLSEPALGVGRSALDEPLSGAEATLLGALAPLAAATPRGVKRFLNAYRVARTGRAHRPALALMLALGQSGDREAVAALETLLNSQDGILREPEGPPALAAAVRAARAASGGDFSIAEAVAARDAARRYQLIA